MAGRTVIAFCVCALIACSHVATQTGQTHGGNPWTVHGVLRIGSKDVPDNLNRMLGTLTIDDELGSFWCARLFNFDDHEKLVPELALEEPTLSNHLISPDGRTITYRLRPGVRWQDGQPFTSADVLFSWQQVMNPNNIVQSRVDYDAIQGVTTPGPTTAVLHMRRPYAPLIGQFFTNYCLLPKHLLAGRSDINHADYNRLPVGTGPFRIVRNEQGVLIRFVANRHYWRGPPRLRAIEWHVIPSETTLLTQIRAHELDFYHLASAAQAPDFASIPGVTIYRYPFSRFDDIGFNQASVAIGDVRVRRALIEGLDIATIIHVATHDIYLRADSDQPPWRWSHTDRMRHYAFAPADAAALLDAAGWHTAGDGIRYKNGEPLRLVMVGSVGSPTQNTAQIVMQQQWRTLGVDVSIKNYPNNVLYALGSGIEQSGKFDLSYEGWTEAGDPDQFQLYGCTMAPPAGWNVYHYCNPALDRAEISARTSYDPVVRRAAYERIQQLVADELPFYVLWFERNQDVVNSDMRGYLPGKTNSAFWNVWDWSI